MASKEDKMVAALKEIIEREGPDWLYDEPYRTHRELVENRDVEKKLSDAVLYFLLSGIMNAGSDDDADTLSLRIQKTLSLNKKMSDRLACIFFSLYSDENRKSWEDMDKAGLEQFLKEDLSIHWRGNSVWEEGNGSVFCHYDADIVLSPEAQASEEKELNELLTRNPFLSCKQIQEHFEKMLKEYLNSEFDEYCTCDDYYQPVVEDFEIEEYISDWCEENGFELIECEGYGNDDGYEPNLRRWY